MKKVKMQLLLVINSAQFTVVLSAVDIYGRIYVTALNQRRHEMKCVSTRARASKQRLSFRPDEMETLITVQ